MADSSAPPPLVSALSALLAASSEAQEQHRLRESLLKDLRAIMASTTSIDPSAASHAAQPTSSATSLHSQMSPWRPSAAQPPEPGQASLGPLLSLFSTQRGQDAHSNATVWGSGALPSNHLSAHTVSETRDQNMTLLDNGTQLNLPGAPALLLGAPMGISSVQHTENARHSSVPQIQGATGLVITHALIKDLKALMSSRLSCTPLGGQELAVDRMEEDGCQRTQRNSGPVVDAHEGRRGKMEPQSMLQAAAAAPGGERKRSSEGSAAEEALQGKRARIDHSLCSGAGELRLASAGATCNPLPSDTSDMAAPTFPGECSTQQAAAPNGTSFSRRHPALSVEVPRARRAPLVRRCTSALLPAGQPSLALGLSLPLTPGATSASVPPALALLRTNLGNLGKASRVVTAVETLDGAGMSPWAGGAGVSLVQERCEVRREKAGPDEVTSRGSASMSPEGKPDSRVGREVGRGAQGKVGGRSPHGMQRCDSEALDEQQQSKESPRTGPVLFGVRLMPELPIHT